MSTPLEKIKEGILANNAYLVAEGYQALTGEDLSSKVGSMSLENWGEAKTAPTQTPQTPQPAASVTEQGVYNGPPPKIEEILKMKKKELLEYCKLQQLQFDSKMKVSELRTVLINNFKEKVAEVEQPKPPTKYKNLFFDDGTLGKEELELDKILTAGVPPARDVSRKITIKCANCEQKNEVHANRFQTQAAIDSYYCHRCQSGRKTR